MNTSKGAGSATTEHPVQDAQDAPPMVLWVADPATYHVPAYLQGLSLRIKQCDLSAFGNDESRGMVMDVAAVIAPKTEAQLAEVLKRFASHGKPLTVGSANTGLSRGAVPAGHGEEVLSMRDFLHVPISSQPNEHYRLGMDESGAQFAVVAPGIALMDFQRFVEEGNLYYPPDPTERTSLIGGNVATNASGAHSFKYGPTRNWVRGLRVALANGDVLDVRRGEVFADAKGRFTITMTDGSTRVVQVPDYIMPKVKNVAGYYAEPTMDLIDLFIGSEGTLGVITQVELGLIPKPAHRYTGNVYFASEENALAFVKAMRAAKGTDGIDPSLLEYFDEAAVAILKQKDPRINKAAKAAVYFEQEIPHLRAATLEDDPVVDTWRGIMIEHGQVDIVEAFSETVRKYLEDLRHRVPEEVNRRIAQIALQYPGAGIRKVATDIAVPDDKLDEMMAYYKEMLAKTSMPSITWGHIGNNHLHVNILPQNPEQFEQAKELLLAFAHKAKELGGTITAEHGIGKIKVEQLKIMVGTQAIDQMAAVKRVLDPVGILGRGNIFEAPPEAPSPLSPSGLGTLRTERFFESNL